jgi:hypothetical protein
MLVTPAGTVHTAVPVLVNERTMYFDEPLVPSDTSTPELDELDSNETLEAAAVTLRVFDAVLALPAASLNAPAATEMVPEPEVPEVVYVAVRVVPLVVSPEIEPRDTVKSAATRSVTSSLKVIVMVQVVPATYEPSAQPARVIVGAAVSTLCVV